jgi:hypothetical protein
MMYLILCESVPHPLESCEWNEDDVCSSVIKYVCGGSLDLDSGLRYMDVIIWVVFYDVEG